LIRVRKPDQAPAVLAQRGPAAVALMLAEAANGAVDFEISREIYAHPSVKASLIRYQHRKCAFCESYFDHVSYGDVEHFRPKGGVTGDDGALEKPGYFWLAYTWSNLYASCQVCNQRYKRNAFPVTGVRATFRAPDLGAEHPLMIDPGVDDPGLHIEFIGSIPRGLSDRGRETIRLLGLDRETIGTRRRDVASDIRGHLDLALKYFDRAVAAGGEGDAEYEDTKRAMLLYAREKMDTKSQYALMARSIIRRHPVAAIIGL
jgi:uncharacterized protein (TIGR02646 family)